MAFTSGDMSTTVNINGNSLGLRDAVDQGIKALTQYTDYLSMVRQSMNLFNDAQKVMSDAFLMQTSQWLQAATSAEDYAARLSYVREQIALTQDQMKMAADTTGNLNGMLGALSNGGGLGSTSGMLGMLTSTGLIDAGGPWGAIAAAAENAPGPLSWWNDLTSGISGAANAVGGFVEQSASFVVAMAGWTILQDAISWVQQLSDELFNLQVQTQRLDTGWQYLLGGGPTGTGVAASRNMMQWTSQFSMGIPFTRQDLMQAVTALAGAGLNAQQIEQFMPYLSDLAATFGSARNINLTTAAQAVVGAQMGRTMQLRYDLLIQPQELVKYGLQATGSGVGMHITDPNSLYRALENFAQAKGVSGASQGIVNSTWWGGWSSLTDQMQNFLLQVGGTNLSGTINPGSFFGTLQQGLDSLLKWFSDHQDQIKSFADILSHLLGDAVSAGGGMLGQFIGYLDKLGVVNDLENGMTKLDDFISQLFGLSSAPYDKKHPMGHRQQYAQQLNQQGGVPDWMTQLLTMAQQIGQVSWQGITDFIQGAAQYGPGIAQAFGSVGYDFQLIGQSMTPDEAKLLDDFVRLLGGTLARAAGGTVEMLALGFKGIAGSMLILATPAHDFRLWVQWMHDYLPNVVQAILKFVDPWQRLHDALKGVNDELRRLPQHLPAWVGGLGGQLGNLTHMPGGFRQFGVTGA